MASASKSSQGSADSQNGITVELLKKYPSVTALSNGLAAAGCTMLMQPVAALRTRLQSLNVYDHGVPQVNRGKIRLLVRAAFKDGYFSLYRGAMCSTVLSALGWFIFRFSYDKISQSKFTQLESKVTNKLYSGCLSSLITTSILHPMWNAKLNLELQSGKTRVDGWPQYRGATHYVIQKYHKEGFLSLYKGWEADVVSVFYYAMVMGMYETMAEIQWNNYPLIADFQGFRPMVNGMLAKLIPTTICYPVYVSRTVQLCHATELSNKRLHNVLLWTLKNKKLKGLYAGFQVQLVKSIISGGITFGIYEVILNTIVRGYNIYNKAVL